MRELTGVGVGTGAAVGAAVVLAPAARPPADEPAATDPATAGADVRAAFDAVADALRARADRAGGTTADVLRATALMAADPGLLAEVDRRLGLGTGPATAVDEAVETFCDLLAASGPYLAERVTDLRDVRDRVVARVLGLPEPGVPDLTGPSVVVARDLAPADTAALDLTRVVGIVTELGGPTSHTAIIAAQFDIPCVVRVAGALDLPDGAELALDARAGTVTLHPGVELRSAVGARRAARAELARSAGGPGRTADGVAVQLLANVGTLEDAERAAALDVEGVGLFRTEVLFLERTTAPTLEEQAEVYARVLRAFGERKVVVRTLDAGADKPLAFVEAAAEENPALGVRGLRTARRHPALLDTQLGALAAAARASGTQPWVMAPMVATAQEAAGFAARARAAGLNRVGAMVEVPAAALRAPQLLAAGLDFVSVGTNDLTQYAMAADRLAGDLAELLDPWQPAVLQLVGLTGSAGAARGAPVGVCGEAARDPLLALVLVGLGVTSLSMAPAAVPAVRSALARTDAATCRAMAAAALAADSPAGARDAAAGLADPGVLAL
ncbi:putative PEP-binding protein [Kineococcus radiotolerans]|uniref:Phosphoenolpyruvate-protein phosphotransferase n=1 Tax=Kineococcus radiotolerans (strain ATCC BAA-149 / DSM 14245 / SRS30216) TaxID=266940 RepID=A6W887_KINRD|nr:putative PEP-binding protein [Kineococcus radiotolerans]ABS03026.1 phosphoenolpyruvate-protein phosphotransferase [Kineococcus radiotolerans SRS30216 = ATCC BAA-149]